MRCARAFACCVDSGPSLNLFFLWYEFVSFRLFLPTLPRWGLRFKLCNPHFEVLKGFLPRVKAFLGRVADTCSNHLTRCQYDEASGELASGCRSRPTHKASVCWAGLLALAEEAATEVGQAPNLPWLPYGEEGGLYAGRAFAPGVCVIALGRFVGMSSFYTALGLKFSICRYAGIKSNTRRVHILWRA